MRCRSSEFLYKCAGQAEEFGIWGWVFVLKKLCFST